MKSHLDSNVVEHLAFTTDALLCKNREIASLKKELQVYKEGVPKLKPTLPYAPFKHLPVVHPTNLVSPHSSGLVAIEGDGREVCYKG